MRIDSVLPEACRRWPRLGVILAAPLLATSCAVAPDPEAIGPYPESYRDIVKAHIETTFYDPYSIRDARMSAPRQGHLFFRQGWLVCVEANAKNRLGGYVGRRRSVYLLNPGAVIEVMEPPPFCEEVAYEPWPELEGL